MFCQIPELVHLLYRTSSFFFTSYAGMVQKSMPLKLPGAALCC